MKLNLYDGHYWPAWGMTMQSERTEATPVEAITPHPPQRLHPATPIWGIARMARGFLPLAALAVVQRLWFLFVIAAIGMVWPILEWWRYTYAIEPNAVRIDEGILSRKRRVVPFDRIQQVSLSQNTLQRLLRTARLRVETAGGLGDTEIDMQMLGLATATRLRDHLMQASAAARGTSPASGTDSAAGPSTAPVAAPAPPPITVVRLSLGEAILAGVLSLRIAAAAAVIGALFQLVDDLPDSVLPNFIADVDLGALLPRSPLAILLTVAGALGVFVLLAALSGALANGRYLLTRSGGDLQLRRGLLERRELVMPVTRIQNVQIKQSLVYRLLGLVSVRVYSGGGSLRDLEVGELTIPILPRRELSRVISCLFSDLPRLNPEDPLSPLIRHPLAALWRRMLRVVVPLTIIAVAVAFWLPPWGLLALLLPVLAAGLTVIEWWGLGHVDLGDYLMERHGALTKVTNLVPWRKVQSAARRTSPGQRRVGVATVRLDLAGLTPDPEIRDAAAARATALLNRVVPNRVVGEAPLPPRVDPTMG